MASRPPDPSSLDASARLLAVRDRIFERWVARVREEIASAAGEPQPVLVDTLPAVIGQLAEALSVRHPRRLATDGSTVAEEHGGERVRVTRFRLEDLIAEYRLLRQVIFEVLEESQPLAPEDRATIHASLDELLQRACAGFVVVETSLREQFFAVLAHDLRNPLSAAKANASLILRRPGAEQTPRWAARVIENVDRVDRMIQDLLDAMRVQAGARMHLELEECDLVELVRETVEQLQTEHGERFVFTAPEPVVGFFAPEPLRRAVENLAVNAVKYGASARPITVAVRQLHGRAMITVHNHGVHIPAEQQETLFRAFQRLTAAERSDRRGWGLGLAQVRGVAEAHGGSIGVDSLPEQGTTFTIDIPRDARPFQVKPTTEPPPTG